MPLHRSFLGRLLVAGALVAIVGGSRVALAQDDDLVEEDNAPAARIGAMRELQFANPALNLDQMDQWVFGRLGGSAGAHAKLDSALFVRIEQVDRVCGLTEVQKIKLRLAGRGDIKRFYDKVDTLKRRFQLAPNNPNANIWQEIQPLQLELNAGLFDDDSIFAKTVRRTLSPEQTARFETRERERTAVRFRATVEWFIAHLDKGLGMTQDQRERFGELLLNETRAPRKFGQGDYWYLMLQMSRLPEARLAPIFDEPQWRLLSRQFAQAKVMVDRLKAAGVLNDDETDRDRPIAKTGRPALLDGKVVEPAPPVIKQRR